MACADHRRSLSLKTIVAVAAVLSPLNVACSEPASTNAYSLFNPAPAENLRAFNTDRPSKSTVPFSVDAGHFQYEADLVNFSQLRAQGGRTDTLLGPNPTMKLGLSDNVDVSVNFAPYQSIHTSSDAGSFGASGIGDTYARVKMNLWGNSGGPSTFAVVSFVKAPTAPAGIGNRSVEGGVILPLSVVLPNEFNVLFNSEFDVLKNSTDNGRHAAYVNVVTLTRPIVKGVTGYVEFWSSLNADPVVPVTQYSLDFALAWNFVPNAQIDFGVNLGLNKETPAAQVYIGLSQRF